MKFVHNLFILAVSATVLLAAAINIPSNLRAQSAANSGEIVGQVLDPSGAAISGAQVAVRNKDTNYTRTVTTDSAGRYTAAQVPLGPYEVSVSAAGFEKQSQDVAVTLGGSVAAAFHMAMGAKSEAIQVNAQAPMLDPTLAPSKSILTALQIKELPSNGRRVQNLVWETPGAQVEPECRNLSISGQKGIFENVNVDGADYVSTFACATGSIRGGTGSAPTINMDALQEFTITRNTFSAEFGRTTGGVINMSTKSGTNLFHGSAEYLFRNADLTALDPFGNVAVTKNQQFGGTFGGPIVKDRTFFFTAPEIQYANKPVLVQYANLDNQSLRNTSAAQLLLSLAPEQTANAISNSQSIVNRIDHRISDSNSFFGRLDFSHAQTTSLTSQNGIMTGPSIASTTTSALSNQTVLDVYGGTLMGQLTTVLSPTRLNELRLQLGREDRPRSPEGNGPQVTVQNAGAVIATYGPQATGVSFGNGQYPSVDNRYNATDNFSIVSGAHSIKFGVDVLRIASNVTFAPNLNGAYTFTSLASFQAIQPAQYSQFTGSGALKSAITEPGFFIQDEWRVLPHLTISPGFRYEMQFNPNYKTATFPAGRAPGATSVPDELKEFEPRLGIAWDVTGDGKTVVRAGGGLYYAPTMMSVFVQGLLFNGGNPELGLGYFTATTNATSVANAFAAAGINLSQASLSNLPVLTPQQYQQLIQAPGSASNGVAEYYINPKFQNPRALQWKIGVDREVSRNIVAGVDFVYVNTVHIARELDVNLPAPAPDATGRLIYSGPRPNPNLGFDVVTDSSAREMYRAMTTSLNVRRQKYVITAYYTLGYNLSMTDSERPVNNILYESAANLKNDYNWSNLDMRHQFTATGVYYLPRGFAVSSTQRFLSGRPFSATTGNDSNQDGQQNDRPLLNGAVIQRNSYRNQAFYNVDLRVEKAFTLPNERGKIIVSADMFNVLNFNDVLLAGSAVSYGNNGTVVQNGASAQVGPQNPATFGQLRNPATGAYYTSNTPGDPFQAQFGVRFEF